MCICSPSSSDQSRAGAFVHTQFQIHPPSPENVEAVFWRGRISTAGFLKYGLDQTRTLTLLKSDQREVIRSVVTSHIA